MTRKHPVLLGIINALLPGLGYLLLGQRKVFGGILFSGVVCSLLIMVVEPSSLYIWLLTTTPLGNVLEVASYTLFTIAFGYDAYALAKEAHAPDLHPMITETT
jgi:phosphotransferase system  glucose/maltose/N-acetylglucosamine-specific IIC component